MYNCEICNYETGDKSNYNKHLKSRKHANKEQGKPNIKLNKCDKCEYESYNMSNYNKHILTHLSKQKRKYTCKACEIEVKDTYDLNKHLTSKQHKECVREKFPNALAKKELNVSDKSKSIQPDKINLYVERKDGKKLDESLCSLKKRLFATCGLPPPVETLNERRKRMNQIAKQPDSDSESESESECESDSSYAKERKKYEEHYTKIWERDYEKQKMQDLALSDSDSDSDYDSD
jgi:hypothetical protein